MGMERASAITPNDIISEADKLFTATQQTWFKPLDPLKEPVEPLEFIIDGFCARGMITMLGASPGAGKSILIQSLFSDHNNSFLNVKKGIKAVYLTGADSSETEIRRRARSLRINSGLYTVAMPDEMYCTATNELFMSDIMKGIKDHAVDALILDTVADFHEGSTYDAELVNKTMAIFRRFAKDTNVALVLITHTKKGSKMKAEYNVEDISDSRIWTSKSDFVFGIKSEYQDDSTNLIELQNLKSRSPRPLPALRASISYSDSIGLRIENTDRSFKSELEETNRDSRKLARISEAKRLQGEGKSVRDIAQFLGVAVGTAHKYLKADNDTVKGIHYDPDQFIND